MAVPESTHLTLFFKKVQAHFGNHLPFVIYKKPDNSKIMGLFQQDNTLYTVQDFEETGYVFAPFEGEEVVLIPENQSEVLVAEWIKPEANQTSVVIENNNSIDKDKHQNLVQQGINAINNGLFSKVVLSRKETVSITNFDIIETYKHLADSYPTAFAYCWYHPKKGLWMGAFSEQLLKIKHRELFTMALAGTQKWQEDSEITWQTKEKEEQQFVTDFIVDNLKPYITSINISDPFSHKAGTVVHIRTDIKVTLNPAADLRQIIAILHPTPAVCGLPKATAKEFILQYEGYNREYYSGYHGELNKDFITGEKQTDLFVNLRCMQISYSKEMNTEAHLYIGGGITKSSIPADEWEETVNKTRTMKKVLV